MYGSDVRLFRETEHDCYILQQNHFIILLSFLQDKTAWILSTLKRITTQATLERCFSIATSRSSCSAFVVLHPNIKFKHDDPPTQVVWLTNLVTSFFSFHFVKMSSYKPMFTYCTCYVTIIALLVHYLIFKSIITNKSKSYRLQLS